MELNHSRVFEDKQLQSWTGNCASNDREVYKYVPELTWLPWDVNPFESWIRGIAFSVERPKKKKHRYSKTGCAKVGNIMLERTKGREKLC